MDDTPYSIFIEICAYAASRLCGFKGTQPCFFSYVVAGASAYFVMTPAREKVSDRTSFARRLPKAAKRSAGRTSAPQVPVNIRVFDVDLSQEERARIRHGLGAKLGKYATWIERVTVRVRDVNGPRGGIDKLCRIKVVLSGLPSVVFESRALSLKAAINGALSGTERAVRRSVQRRHTKPIKVATRGALHPDG